MRLMSAAVLLGMLMAVSAFGSSDDRFLKKYAMMKIYESCFGAEVVKEIRQEMKAACAKCAAPEIQQNAQIFTGRIPPSFVQGMNNNLPAYMNLGEASQDANQNGDNSLGPQVGTSAPATPEQAPPLDTEKLQQAIFSIRIPQPMQNYPVPNYAFRGPFGPLPYQQQSPFQQQAYPQQLPYQQQSPFSQQPSLFQQPQAFMQPWGAQPYSAAGPFPSGFIQPYQFYGNRASREMDFRSRLEMLTSRANGKVRNVTCVMQELGYLDQNLEPNYEKISERIANLPVSKELKSDIQDGLQFCQQFAQCVPETKKENSPLSRELLKPMFFFRCYKHKKLEACIMKDVRDRFGSEDELDTDTDFRSISRAGRAMKSDGAGSEQTSDSSEEMAAAMYDFLYGSHDSESDAFL